MSTLEIPERRQAVTKEVQVPVSAKGEDGETVNSEFTVELPANLASAIALEGERDVFRRYVNSKIIQLQANERRKLVGKESKGRVRAKYMEDLGI
jgi:hypothetical protein